MGNLTARPLESSSAQKIGDLPDATETIVERAS